MPLKKQRAGKKSIKKRVPPKAGKKKETKKAVPSKTSRRPSKKKTAPSRSARPIPEEVAGLEKIGEVTHYFPHVKVAAILIGRGELAVGESIYIKGHTTDHKQGVVSMQLDHVTVQIARKKDEIGLRVGARARRGDAVYKL